MDQDTAAIDWRVAVAIVFGLGGLLLLTCTNFVAHCRSVWRVVALMWAARAQLYAMSMMVSRVMLDGADGAGGGPLLGAALPFEAPPARPARPTKAEKKAARRRRHMRPPVE